MQMIGLYYLVYSVRVEVMYGFALGLVFGVFWWPYLCEILSTPSDVLLHQSAVIALECMILKLCCVGAFVLLPSFVLSYSYCWRSG